MEYNGAVLQLLTGFKEALCFAKYGGLYNNNTSFGTVKKLVRFVNMCLKYGYGNICLINFLFRIVRNK
jgi:hypothetical protein